MNKYLLIAAALSLSSIAGQAQTPTFRTETTAVQLPVRVLDGKGSFVRDLTAADIEVLEDGVPQTISEFTLVDLSTASKQAPLLNTPSTGVLSHADLERVEGRLYVFLMDDVHVGMAYSARARDLIRGFIRERMMPGDAAAVVIASGAARQDFTHDKQALLKAVERFTGTLDAGEPARVQETRARGIVKLVADLAAALGQIRGRHKTLIYVGSQVGCRVSFETTTDFLPTFKGEQLEARGDKDANMSAAGTGAAADATDQIICNEQLWDGVRAAVQANVSLYSIDPRGMQNRGWISPTVDGFGGPDSARRRMATVEPGRPSVLDGFYVLADHTGGFAVTGTNNFRDPFDRIVRESSTYYLLAYTSTNNKIDGKYRRTQINVKRPGVQAFYRSGYMARRP
jgi:VWFA-related protein